jgi:hypothetical protein
MKKAVARFQVSSRIAHLLSQEYSSSEKALKELVDNAWDAEAESVHIALPRPMTDDTIQIMDDGTGMTEEELRRHYLDIAADRRARRGERSAIKGRRVKGRKGIGKFAGLMAASEMRLETSARGVTSSFTLRLADLASVEDIETLPIEITTQPCAPALHGTRITLSDLHSGYSLPDPKKFRQVLLQEYGRETDIVIYVDGKPLGIDDVDGKYEELTIGVNGVGDVRMRFAITETNTMSRQAGLTLRVDGKAIGKPGFFGLDTRDDFPQKLLKKLYGEVDADGLREHVTAGWDSVVENSELLAAVVASVQPILVDAFKERYQRDLQLAHARLRREVHERLSKLPEFRREYAERAIRKVLDRFFGEPPEKIEPFVYVLLEAIENADYGAVLQHLAECDRSDVSSVADALAEFGLAEMAYLVEQAKARQSFLDRLEALGQNKKTLEIEMHKAIEKSLWILGPQYTLFSSNKTLARQTSNYLTDKFAKARANTRPDLLLNEDLNGRALLIEFKRPSHALNHDDYRQAITYRHDLLKGLNKEIEVLVMGGSRSADFPMSHLEPGVRAVTYDDVIASARRQLQWQLQCDD